MTVHYVEVLHVTSATWRTDTVGRPRRCEDRWWELDRNHYYVRVVKGDGTVVIEP